MKLEDMNYRVQDACTDCVHCVSELSWLICSLVKPIDGTNVVLVKGICNKFEEAE